MQNLYEPCPVPDTFCSGVEAAIENIGDGCLRFYLYVREVADAGEEAQRLLVVKLVFPSLVVPDAVLQMLRPAAGQIADLLPLVDGLLH